MTEMIRCDKCGSIESPLNCYELKEIYADYIDRHFCKYCVEEIKK